MSAKSILRANMQADLAGKVFFSFQREFYLSQEKIQTKLNELTLYSVNVHVCSITCTVTTLLTEMQTQN